MPLEYDGTLPSWISIDEENSRLVGAPGTFQAGSQAEANSIAQAALDAFAEAALLAGTLNCGGEELSTLIIEGYFDGFFVNTGPASGLTVWDGTFVFHNNSGADKWKASDGTEELSMDGELLCGSYVYVDGADYVLQVWAGGAGGLVWQGIRSGNESPLGTYNRVDGSDTTESVVIINNPDPEQATDTSLACQPS